MPTSNLLAATDRLRNVIEAAKQAEPHEFEWYPYDSLTNVYHLDELLGTKFESLLQSGQSDGVLDIGCQDGDLSFLFESLGCKVTSVDHPITNHNGMAGVRALKRLLNSSIEIHEVDLDSPRSLPGERYGLTLFLGVLYHLKSPFYVLEQVAKHSKYCLLSTRIARCFPGGSPMPENVPLAYLLDSEELNDDNSNYWIFSDPGIQRLVKRTRWEILESLRVGDTKTSDPTSLEHDERVFFLLKSRYGLSPHALSNVELLEGWHWMEVDGWRWTKQRFSLRASFVPSHKRRRIILRLFVPPNLIKRLGPMTLCAAANGVELPPATFSSSGNYEFGRSFRAEGDQAEFTFTLDKAVPPEECDGRELGIIVASIELE